MRIIDLSGSQWTVTASRRNLGTDLLLWQKKKSDNDICWIRDPSLQYFRRDVCTLELRESAADGARVANRARRSIADSRFSLAFLDDYRLPDV